MDRTHPAHGRGAAGRGIGRRSGIAATTLRMVAAMKRQPYVTLVPHVIDSAVAFLASSSSPRKLGPRQLGPPLSGGDDMGRFQSGGPVLIPAEAAEPVPCLVAQE